ncbi:MAG: MptD family putative ECF transporter S component [Bacteroidales bacterium]|nr:MptD family putative ECF transporter S component [Bacteroidales bacterium]
MEKNVVKWWRILGMGLLYLFFVFASCFAGFLHPVCWAYFSVLAAILASGPYFWLAAHWQKLGVGTFCALLVCLFCLATGEAGGLLSKAIILGGGVLADIVRQFMGNGSRKALYCAYPFLAIGNIGWIIRLWSDKQFYYDGAVEEMGQAYAEGIKALQTPGHLVAVIVLTATAAVLGVWLCTKIDKKSSNLLQ